MKKMISAVLVALATYESGQGRVAAAGKGAIDPDSGHVPRLAVSNNPHDDWAFLQTLPIGCKLQLKMKDGAEIAGTLISARGESVDLDNVIARHLPQGVSLNTRETLYQSEVVSLQVLSPQSGSRHRGVSWKALVVVGAVVGAFVILHLISMTAE